MQSVVGELSVACLAPYPVLSRVARGGRAVVVVCGNG